MHAEPPAKDRGGKRLHEDEESGSRSVPASLHPYASRGAVALPKEPAGSAAPAGKPEEITFANLPEWCELFCHCKRCGRVRRVDRHELAQRFGKTQSIIALAPRMRCRQCKNADGNVIKIGRLKR